MRMIVGIVVGLLVAIGGGWIIYQLWNRERVARINENIRAEVDRVRAGGAIEGNSFVPAVLAGNRMTIPAPV